MAAPKDSGYIQTSDPSRPRSDAAVPFREIIPPPMHPKVAGIQDCDALSWTDSRRKIPAPAWLITRLEAQNLEKPYAGFTTDGVVRDAVWDGAYSDDEGAPVEAATAAANALLGQLSDEERSRTVYASVEDDAIRLWSNPELYVNPGGLRLDEVSGGVRDAVHALLRASLSPAGYDKVLGCCLTNGFLGHLVNGRKVLNEDSYNFRFFSGKDGRASTAPSEPWGFTFFGHHLCLCVVFSGRRMVIGPSFMGAEPDRIDEGPHAGLRLFHTEEMESLKLMQSLGPAEQARARLSAGMGQESLGPERWNPFDERHLGGARQDNRVLPFEGIPYAALPPAQQDQLLALYRAFNEYYPAPVLERRVDTFKQHLDETYFAWIGPHGDDDPYYFRIHSPVAFCEFDFHCGIFLTNSSPARCHIHTINRLPNRGDYGRALVEQVLGKKKEKGKGAAVNGANGAAATL
ncbi:uncharacterized protein J3D65DRAFT_643144 [Phyllosticta citribraziliensis]|uniref:Uncharacterized protein n=1 Tax=Phyllosticta citribraziliensis TaxID=989973 RepID=A0ABR1L1N3_9PEZI